MIYRFNPFSLDTERYLLERDGDPVAVEPQVFDLLVYLIDNRGRVVTRDELLNNLWAGKIVSDSALNARLKAARKAVGDSGTTQGVIKTTHGRGYQFIAPVETAPESTKTESAEAPEEQADKPSIAVLPFENLSPNHPESETLSGGITEDIVNALSRVPSVVVIASYSTRTYKDQAVDIRQVAQEQGVRYVLEGGVQLSGKRARITAQLIDATSGSSIWGDRYDRELRDLFQIQDDITRSIVTALQVELTWGEDVLTWGEGTDSVEAWLCVTRASDLLNLYIRESTFEARRLGERAIELDPEYAPAWNVTGWAHYEDGLWEWTEERAPLAERAMECAEKGLKLNLNNPNPYDWSLRACVYWLRGEFERAIEDARTAVRVAPGSHENIMILALILANSDHPTEALQLARRGIRLCPVPPVWSLYTVGICHYLNQDYDEALDLFDRAVYKEPLSAVARIYLVNTLAHTGDLDRAECVATKILEIEPSFSCGRWFGLTQDMPMMKNPAQVETIINNLAKAGLPV